MSEVPTKTSMGLEPNLAAALSYVLSPLTGIIFYLVEKENDYVRFHAMQSIIFGVAYIILSIGLSIVLTILSSIVSALICLSGIANLVIMIGAFVLWVLLIMKAYQGQRYHLPYIGDMAEKYVKGS